MLNFLSFSSVHLQTYQPQSCGLNTRMIGVVTFGVTKYISQIKWVRNDTHPSHSCHSLVIQLSYSCHTIVIQITIVIQLSYSCRTIVTSCHFTDVCVFTYFDVPVSKSDLNFLGLLPDHQPW